MRIDGGGQSSDWSGMDTDDARQPALAKIKTPQEIRLEREAAALRANLRKRKEQARARAASVNETKKDP